MTLVQEIVSGAAGSVPVSELLRKLKVLSRRTGTDALEAWVEQELRGYPADADLPAYRGPFDLYTVGYFVGGFGFEAHVAIPSTCITDPDLRQRLFTVSFRESITEMESLSGQPEVKSGWSAEAVAYYNACVESGDIQSRFTMPVALVSTSQVVPPNFIAGVTGAVRDRILDLALELESVAPTAGQPDTDPTVRAEAATIINNNFIGPVGAVAVASTNVSQQTVQLPSPGDAEALVRYLEAQGLAPEGISQLRALIAADQAEATGSDAPNRWARVGKWLADVGADVSKELLASAAKAALQHFLP